MQERSVSGDEPAVGTWRRFGPVGPVYQIIGTAAPSDRAGERTMRIRVLETGEELEYSVREILDDPRER